MEHHQKQSGKDTVLARRKSKKIMAILSIAGAFMLALSALPAGTQAVAAEGEKPNILIIWGDDIGQFNVSAYNMGMMGYKTPNIDRIGQEGAVFTDW